jgi:hypothetical protein
MRTYLASLILVWQSESSMASLKYGLRHRPRSHFLASSVCWLESRPYRSPARICSKATSSSARHAIAVKRRWLTTAAAPKRTGGASDASVSDPVFQVTRNHLSKAVARL